MAVGDAVSVLSATTGSFVSFTPAVGVEIMISSCLSHIHITDGTIISNTFDGVARGNLKFFINNTNYIGFYSAIDGTSITGIQIK
jgi:hypothetical protein|tara:strand:+ start:1062 stop:1316 length:255 start_codon:yes stop_codon:yes gene_type:complete